MTQARYNDMNPFLNTEEIEREFALKQKAFKKQEELKLRTFFDIYPFLSRAQ